MKKLKPRGLSLAETLLTLLLFGMALVVISQLVAGSQDLVRKAAGRTQAIRATQWALTEIRHKVEVSSSVEQPALDASAPTLELTAFRRDEVGRLPDPVPDRYHRYNDPPWLPFDENYLEAIEFMVVEGQLIESSGSTNIYLAGSVEKFWVKNSAEQLQIEITLNEGTRKTHIVSRVIKP